MMVSAKTCFFQHIVRLNDLPKTIFKRTVATICIRMMLFDKFFIAGLYLRGIGTVVEVQSFKGMFLRRDKVPPLTGGGGLALRFVVSQQIKRIIHAVGPLAAAPALGFHCRFVDTHFPGRAVACEGIFLVAAQLRVIHALKIVVGLVVFTHVVDAEAKELSLAAPAFGRPVRSGIGAALPFTFGVLLPFGLFLRRLDANGVENVRFVGHSHMLAIAGNDQATLLKFDKRP